MSEDKEKFQPNELYNLIYKKVEHFQCQMHQLTSLALTPAYKTFTRAHPGLIGKLNCDGTIFVAARKL